jgi:hypothetical protein
LIPKKKKKMVPVSIDIFDRVIILSNVYIVCTLSQVGVVCPKGLFFDFGG